MTTTVLKQTGGTDGFGVFAYHTAGSGADASYNNTTSLPNFMYNERVYWDGSGGKWIYSPVKYWPNESAAAGTVDGATGNNASTTSGRDKLTFFAYAPYVALSGSAITGTGITAINKSTVEGGTATPSSTGNKLPGDPLISYQVEPTIGTGVDLCWGVVPSTTSYTTVTGTNDNPTTGLPNLNLTKQEVNETVDFLFKHALTKVKFTIQAAVNQAGAGGTLDSNTRIYVNSVSFTADTKLPLTGNLNLNNTSANEPLWQNTAGTATLTSGTLNTALQTPNAGVEPTAPKDLFTDSNPWYYLIPSTSAGDFTITANYDVITTDGKLDGGKSTVNNIISKTTSIQFLPGKAYTINIVLGLTSVDFTATVTDWVDEGIDVDLPMNLEEFASGSAPTPSVTANATSYSFTLTGVTDTGAFTATITASDSSTPIAITPASGTFSGTKQNFTASFPVNTTGASRTFTITITDTTASSSTTIVITQAA